MRASRVVTISLLLLSMGGGLAAAPEAIPPPHQITCSSPKVGRTYQEALRSYHLGRLEEAVKQFRAAIKRDQTCAMARWGLSRALHKSGKTPEALLEAAEAEKLAPGADDREQKLIAAWHRYLKAQSEPEAEQKKSLDQVRRDLDTALSIHFEDPEVWILKGDVMPGPLRATPFYLGALRFQPDHPLGTVWKPVVPPAPDVKPAPTKPVEPPAYTPQLFEGLGKLTHPITTVQPQAQAYYEQGLRCWHSYVTPRRVKNGAYVNFQQAANLDPECGMAYWGLSLAANNGDPIKPLDAANRALELTLKKGTDKERRMAAARVLELTKDKREAFLDALEGAIAAYPDDVELWVWRGKVHGTSLMAIPYQLAAHKIQPEHPSPNHELVHAYESVDRPALGWPYTWGYRNSAPNMPHANHMQAHLAMRVGRWEEAIDCTRASRRKSLEGFPELDPSHHIDTMIRALAHEGRFKEAESEPKAYRNGLPWARLLQLKGDLEALAAWVEDRKKNNTPESFYLGAIVELNRGNPEAAKPLLERVEQDWKKNPRNIYRYHEVKGRFLVQTGQAEEGLKLLREAAAQAVKDPGLHAWGGGSYVLEVWGETALRAHRWDEAEEAYHEALAHEHGSILGALGMQVVWERRGDREMADHYAARAAAIWKGADPGMREMHLERLRKLAAGTVAANAGVMK